MTMHALHMMTDRRPRVGTILLGVGLQRLRYSTTRFVMRPRVGTITLGVGLQRLRYSTTRFVMRPRVGTITLGVGLQRLRYSTTRHCQRRHGEYTVTYTWMMKTDDSEQRARKNDTGRPLQNEKHRKTLIRTPSSSPVPSSDTTMPTRSGGTCSGSGLTGSANRKRRNPVGARRTRPDADSLRSCTTNRSRRQRRRPHMAGRRRKTDRNRC
ncbi:hypothetical protein DPMN_148828 [Dreissena polymorpha]|uniref:Uncharacterized protein n=1 Tax=Dreissena polymorpha TaxID=45954 RepID=A0A9D4FAC1_DREPO|nr:hypothetical protein DPMN_148828 [Dreissena polymorpha]